jgi:enamine deaminase RidA (YjgF/YER057c/UK114 family)
VPANARWLVISGQVGIAPDGKIADGIEAQLEQIYANIETILKSAGMGIADLVKLTVFLTRPEDLAVARRVRDKHMAGHKAASTLVFISGLVNPALLAEIEALAAKS